MVNAWGRGQQINTRDQLIELCLFMSTTRHELIIKLTFSVSKYARYFLVRSSTNHRFFQFLRTSEQKKPERPLLVYGTLFKHYSPTCIVITTSTYSVAKALVN